MRSEFRSKVNYGAGGEVLLVGGGGFDGAQDNALVFGCFESLVRRGRGRW